MTVLDRTYQEAGFDDERDAHRLIAGLDLTTRLARQAFEVWKREHGDKASLLKLQEEFGSTREATQLERARNLVSPLRTAKTRDLMAKLRDILGEAQNSAPLGDADGSMTEDAWTALRDVVRSLDNLADAIDHFKRVSRS